MYELAAKEGIKDLPAGFPAFIKKEKLLPLLRPPEQVIAPKPPPPPPPPLKDETNGKTFIEGWLFEHRNDRTVHLQFTDALRGIWRTYPPGGIYGRYDPKKIFETNKKPVELERICKGDEGFGPFARAR